MGLGGVDQGIEVFGILLQGDSLGTLCWLGGGLIGVAILVVEPPVAEWLRARWRARRPAPALR